MSSHIRPGFRFAITFAVAACALAGGSAALAQQPGPTRAQLETATYPVALAPGGNATLTGGRFEAPAAPGSASKVTVSLHAAASGVIGGQPGAAVVLASSGGGSGTFFELYAVDAAAKTIARASLGDRIVLNALSVDASGHIIVAMVGHRAGDPLCCPTAPQTREYALQGGALVLVATTPAPAPPPRPAATGTAGVEDARAFSALVEAIVLGAVLATSVAARALIRRSASSR